MFQMNNYFVTWRDRNNDFKAKGTLPPKKYDAINQVNDDVITFKEVYEMWLNKQKNGWKESHAIGVQQKAEKYLLPPLSNLPIDSIETKMLIDLLLIIDEEGKFETREKVQSIVTRVISHLIIPKLVKRKEKFWMLLRCVEWKEKVKMRTKRKRRRTMTRLTHCLIQIP